MQINQFDARHRAQNIFRRLDHPKNAWMAVERDPHRHTRAQHRPQPVEVLAKEHRERCHLEWLGTAGFLDCRQRRFSELNLA
jgi:hypothetical protein